MKFPEFFDGNRVETCQMLMKQTISPILHLYNSKTQRIMNSKWLLYGYFIETSFFRV
jgi:hypothetical protein